MMFNSFYQLQSNPFGVLPPEHPLYLTEFHKEALATLVYALMEKKPFVAIIGEVGTGKSTVLKAALARIQSQPIRVVEVSHPLISPDRVAQLLAEAIGLVSPETMTVGDIDSIDRAFLSGDSTFSHTALVIDEAQLLPGDTLEFIRLVSNMKAAQSGLLQFLFVGQPEFWTLLETDQFRHLRQRISLRCEIPALSPVDSRNYLTFRLQLAGATLAQTFTADAVTQLIKLSGGIPRRINNIADNALLVGYGVATRPVTAKIVKEAVRSLDGENTRGLPLPWLRIGAAAAAIVVSGAIGAIAAIEWGLVRFEPQAPQRQSPQLAVVAPPPIASPAPVAERTPQPTQPAATSQTVPGPLSHVPATSAAVAEHAVAEPAHAPTSSGTPAAASETTRPAATPATRSLVAPPVVGK